ncbi:MAG: bifunctional class I SAM-dependent methyltransferase/glycosyltransferase family 2 protein [Acidobacteriota bacterium]
MGANSRAFTWEEEHRTRAARDRRDGAGSSGLWKAGTIVERLWTEAEKSREKNWQRDPAAFWVRLRGRAFLAARSLPILPGGKVLELGAGSGVWTEYLAAVLAGQNPITAVVFNEDLAREAQSRKLPNATFIHVRNFQHAYAEESFDYIVGMEGLTAGLCRATLDVAYRYLKPWGQLIFFAENPSNPLILLRRKLDSFAQPNRKHRSEQGTLQGEWIEAAVDQGFSGIEVTPCEVIHPLKSSAGQAVGLILERAPVACRFSRVVTFRAVKPAACPRDDVPQVNLATHRQLFDAVSVVVPCHNEEANISRLVKTVLGMYSDYIREIVIVDDNSTDRTAEVAEDVASAEPRIKLVRRTPPGGVGRALRDGYAAANGRYILSTDCDFVTIAAEFKGLFDAIAEGYDGAIGSRFSSESALVHYPFFKILCNRGYHMVLNLLLGTKVRDISNNLKLYRADILKNLDIEEDHFAANVETGLKPFLLNYRILEVPTSWINRTADMGKSSFKLLSVGPDYLGVLLRTTWRFWRGQYRVSS